MKEMTQGAKSRFPPTDALEQLSQSSRYDAVPEGEEDFEIPARGTASYKALEVLAPKALSDALEKQKRKKPPDGSQKGGEAQEGSAAGQATPVAPSVRSKRTDPLQTVRKSKRLAKKFDKCPGAPSKKSTRTDDEQDIREGENVGFNLIIGNLKDMREEIMDYVQALNDGTFFHGNISSADPGLLVQALEELDDFKRGSKAAL